MLMLLFWITFIIGVILYFAVRPVANNVYVGLAPFALFILDIGLLGAKVFGFNL